jgi:hypothetical protein
MPKTRLRSHILEPVEQVLGADVVAAISPATPVQLFRFNLPIGGQYFLEAMIAGEMLAATTARVLTTNLTSSHGALLNYLTTFTRVGTFSSLSALASYSGPPINTANFGMSFSSVITRSNAAFAGRLTIATASDVVLTAVVTAEACTVKAGSWIRATYLRPDA